MQDMLRAEHGGMNEVFADVAEITGDKRYLALAQRFSHRAVLQPLAEQRDQLTGLHANTQIPKVIGYGRLAELTQQPEGRAAEFFWHTVVDKRSVAIGGNSVREHFHPGRTTSSPWWTMSKARDLQQLNARLTALLHRTAGTGAEQASWPTTTSARSTTTSSPRSTRKAAALSTSRPMRPQHYRVYSQVDQGMWCCVGQASKPRAPWRVRLFERGADKFFVNLFVASSVDWRERSLRLTQSTNFPDEARTQLKIEQGAGRFTPRCATRPGWRQAACITRSTAKPVAVKAKPGSYVEPTRDWKAGDRVVMQLPMRTHVEPMPRCRALRRRAAWPHRAGRQDQPDCRRDAQLQRADDSRMGHSPSGPSARGSRAIFVGEQRDIARRLRPRAGQVTALHRV